MQTPVGCIAYKDIICGWNLNDSAYSQIPAVYYVLHKNVAAKGSA